MVRVYFILPFTLKTTFYSTLQKYSRVIHKLFTHEITNQEQYIK